MFLMCFAVLRPSQLLSTCNFLVAAGLLQPISCSHVHNSSTKNPCDMAETPTSHLSCVLDSRHQSILKNHPTLTIRNLTYRHPMLVELPVSSRPIGVRLLIFGFSACPSSLSVRNKTKECACSFPAVLFRSGHFPKLNVINAQCVSPTSL